MLRACIAPPTPCGWSRRAENTFTTFGPTRRVREGEETTGALDVLAAPIEVSTGTTVVLTWAATNAACTLRGLNHLQLDDSAEV